MYVLLCAAVFTAAYLVNATTISIFYHRGLAHQAVTLRPWARRSVGRFGIWITGLDPVGWVCMHRRHHDYSDTSRDPHSPVHLGAVGVLTGQLRSYERTLIGLARGESEYTSRVEDIEFPVSWINRKGLWLMPYAAHLVVAMAIALPTGMWALGACYYVGMMSHPIEGWMVNSLGHAVGSRNFDTADNSRNNHLAAWLILGEGYQNNHHRYPASARFSYRDSELDLGYALCLLLERAGFLEISRANLIPQAPRQQAHQPVLEAPFD
jgi:stearoyl-CoA desaturase (delta-9 desaturase)